MTYQVHKRFGRGGWGMLSLVVLGTALAVGCRDELTAPGDCPALCPGGQPPVLEAVLPTVANLDSSFVGYVPAGLGISLRVSNGLPASEDRAIVLFLPRPDSVQADSLRPYTIDSVSIGLTLQARDTLVNSLRFLIYRLPITIDTLTTFADIAPDLILANLIDSMVVPDSVKNGPLELVLSGADLARVDIPAQDSGKLAIGIAMAANAPTGVRIASIAATGSPRFTSFVSAIGSTDSTKEKQIINRFPNFASFVSQNPPAVDNDLLAVGGSPSARARIKFDLTQSIRDSVTILRATLELTTNSTVLGLPNDPGTLQAIGVIGDLGAKSPLLLSAGTIGVNTLDTGTSGVVEVDVTRLVRLWQGENGLPSILFVAIAPEAATFTRPVFRSSRSGSGAPQLRITYFEKFPFQRF